MIVKCGLVYYLCINIVMFFTMLYDKQRAKSHKWRVRENTLFSLAILGGSAGGFLAMFMFHHKNRKPVFYVVYSIGFIIHCFFIYYLVFYKGVI